MHLNSKDAISEFGLYEFTVDGELHKIGKADLARTSKGSGLPERMHQQLRELKKEFAGKKVEVAIVETLGTVTTEDAVAAETKRLQDYYDRTGLVPLGNEKSFTPKKSPKP